jgi:transposase
LAGEEMEESNPIPKLEVEDIDHLGLIAGIVDDIGLVEIINERIESHAQEKVSAGQVVKALILNCMGFLTAPLYLFHQFFEGKATEHLIGEGVQAEYLNARRIGRVLDDLYKYGISTLFMVIALEVVKKFGVSVKRVHGDSTSFYVYCDYKKEVEGEGGGGELEDQSQGDGEPKLEQLEQKGEAVKSESQEESDFVPISMERGYSRDHRPDLKQFTLNLITTTDGDIPLGLRLGNGNEVDSQVLAPFLKQWQESWEEIGGERPQVLAADAALFTQDNLRLLGELPWISRVPATVGEARQLMQTQPQSQFQASALPDYRYSEVSTTYGEVQQRWLIVESQARLQADLPKLDQKLDKILNQHNKQLQQLSTQAFACEADALQAAQAFGQSLQYYLLQNLQILTKPHYSKPGRPSQGETPSHYTFHISAEIVPKPEAIQRLRSQAGRFIIATNLLDDQTWSNDQLLQEYKNQTCERGFRFLKDPLFFVSRVFLKSPKRIMVLTMIMALSLMVYCLGQRQLRLALAHSQATLEDQKGKPTSKPTLRWLFQCFLSIHLVWLDGSKTLIQLSPRQRRILHFFTPNCQKYYFLDLSTCRM